jgi:hypothetical protein
VIITRDERQADELDKLIDDIVSDIIGESASVSSSQRSALREALLSNGSITLWDDKEECWVSYSV